MPEFSYKARDRFGGLVSATISAPNESTVREQLREQQLILLSIRQEESAATSLKRMQQFIERVGVKHLVIFARQLSVLVSATVPIVRALRILTEQTEDKVLQRVVTDVANRVDGGARLSSALHAHSHIFDDFFVYMIRAGETTGRLDEVLNYLADQKEKDYQLRSKVLTAMIYPAFIVLVLIGVFIVMMVYVVPKMLEVVRETGAELPLPTKILIYTSDFFNAYWWLLLIGCSVFVGLFSLFSRMNRTKKFIHRLRISIPIIGNIFRRVYLARIAQSLSSLLASGVPVNRSLEIAADVVGNEVYREILMTAQNDVEGGRSISASLQTHKIIPPMMVQMMDIGEETGRLDQILQRIAQFYMQEVESLTEALTSIIEPMIIILLGAGALILVSGILLPIYSITEQF